MCLHMCDGCDNQFQASQADRYHFISAEERERRGQD